MRPGNDEGPTVAAVGLQGQTTADNAIVADPAGQRKAGGSDLAAQINAEHAAAHADARSALERARNCGALLLQAKAQTAHGAWLPWIDANLTFGARQAQKYIRLAESWERLPNANSDSLLPSIDAALATVAEPQTKQTELARERPGIQIPLGSVGRCEWTDANGQPCLFEAHSVLWLDGETVGLHFAMLFLSRKVDHGASAEFSRRPIRASARSVEMLAAPYRVPMERMQVFQAAPVLWPAVAELPA